jgi:photosystem II stability/assembly factor-like uncharacterized protein
MIVPFRCSAEDIHNAGMSCGEDDPCPIFLEIAATEAVGNRIFAAGNIHTESATLYSVLLGSENGGQSWSEAHSRIAASGLDRIQFRDATTGWIAGEEQFPLPQNPFLLVTTDGGKSWIERAVLNDAAENRFGSVQQFVFSDKENGSLILDRGAGNPGARYVLLESRTGGETWTVQQESNRPLRLREPASAPASWRVRVDGPSRSFHIERRQGERWSGVAAFAVRLDPCKPPSPPPPPAVGQEQ